MTDAIEIRASVDLRTVRRCSMCARMVWIPAHEDRPHDKFACAKCVGNTGDKPNRGFAFVGYSK